MRSLSNYRFLSFCLSVMGDSGGGFAHAVALPCYEMSPFMQAGVASVGLWFKPSMPAGFFCHINSLCVSWEMELVVGYPTKVLVDQ